MPKTTPAHKTTFLQYQPLKSADDARLLIHH